MPIDHPGPRAETVGSAAAEGAIELAYRYAPLLADYCRAGAGLALAGIPLVALDPAWPVRIGLLALAALFAVLLAQTWQRQHSRLRLSPAGVTLLAREERRLDWSELDG